MASPKPTIHFGMIASGAIRREDRDETLEESRFSRLRWRVLEYGTVFLASSLRVCMIMPTAIKVRNVSFMPQQQLRTADVE